MRLQDNAACWQPCSPAVVGTVTQPGPALRHASAGWRLQGPKTNPIPRTTVDEAETVGGGGGSAHGRDSADFPGEPRMHGPLEAMPGVLPGRRARPGARA